MFLTRSRVRTTPPGTQQERGHHGIPVGTTGFKESRSVGPEMIGEGPDCRQSCRNHLGAGGNDIQQLEMQLRMGGVQGLFRLLPQPAQSLGTQSPHSVHQSAGLWEWSLEGGGAACLRHLEQEASFAPFSQSPPLVIPQELDPISAGTRLPQLPSPLLPCAVTPLMGSSACAREH